MLAIYWNIHDHKRNKRTHVIFAIAFNIRINCKPIGEYIWIEMARATKKKRKRKWIKRRVTKNAEQKHEKNSKKKTNSESSHIRWNLKILKVKESQQQIRFFFFFSSSWWNQYQQAWTGANDVDYLVLPMLVNFYWILFIYTSYTTYKNNDITQTLRIACSTQAIEVWKSEKPQQKKKIHEKWMWSIEWRKKHHRELY